MSDKFQVNLQGIIELLSEHLYSSPSVYVRELLQNSVDAISARRRKEPGFEGRIRVEVVTGGVDAPLSVIFEDNGIGLTEAEARKFLSTIGESSKRRDRLTTSRPDKDDFIGQFGIGLLSAFVVSDEVVVVTKSVQPDEPAIEWRGKSDGVYSVRAISKAISPGTRVFLRARKGGEEHLEPARVRELIQHYGSLLPVPITFTQPGGVEVSLNQPDPPWMREASRVELLAYGRDVFETEFLDAFPLRSRSGGIEGVAFVEPGAGGGLGAEGHLVYLKRMLLTEDARGLLPDWAFFIRCIVNTNELRPTASREGFYEDRSLEKARHTLGDVIVSHLVHLSKTEPERLGKIIAVHHLAIKELAVDDEDALKVFADWLPFETNRGTISLGEYRRSVDVVRYVPLIDTFRQISRLAGAQGMWLLNAGYVFEKELITRLTDVIDGIEIEEVDAESLAKTLSEPPDADRVSTDRFLRRAQKLLKAMRVGVTIRSFKPHTMVAMFSGSEDAHFNAAVDRTTKNADPLFASLIGHTVGQTRSNKPRGTLCFNHANSVVQRLIAAGEAAAADTAIPILYVHALLLGHHPLGDMEMDILDKSLLEMIEWGLNTPEA